MEVFSSREAPLVPQPSADSSLPAKNRKDRTGKGGGLDPKREFVASQ